MTDAEQYRPFVDRAIAELGELDVPESEARPILTRLILGVALTIHDEIESAVEQVRHG